MEPEPPPVEKPPMPEVLRPLALEAIKRHKTRGATPEIVTKAGHGVYENLTCPYRDEDEELWLALLLECFGTRLCDVGQAFFRQIEALCPEVLYAGETHQRRDEESTRQALAIMSSLAPRNEAESAAAAQMVALYLTNMRIAAHCARSSWMDTKTAGAMANLSKAYLNGMRTLQDGRQPNRAKRQIIKVEKHVHQHLHYTQGGGGGKSGSQPHGAGRQRARASHAGEPEGCAPMPSANEGGEILLQPCREGEEGLPNTWGSGGLGSAEGEGQRCLEARRLHQRGDSATAPSLGPAESDQAGEA